MDLNKNLLDSEKDYEFKFVLSKARKKRVRGFVLLLVFIFLFLFKIIGIGLVILTLIFQIVATNIASIQFIYIYHQEWDGNKLTLYLLNIMGDTLTAHFEEDDIKEFEISPDNKKIYLSNPSRKKLFMHSKVTQDDLISKVLQIKEQTV